VLKFSNKPDVSYPIVGGFFNDYGMWDFEKTKKDVFLYLLREIFLLQFQNFEHAVVPTAKSS